MPYRTFLSLLLCCFGITHAQQWHTFGDFPFLSVPAEGPSGLTNGYLQPSLWVDPPIVDTVTVEDTGTFLFDLHDPRSPYAPFVFDTAAATRSGWYRYTVREPYHNGLRTDSLFVRFLPDSTTNGGNDTTRPRPPVPPINPARIVNLVVLDNHGLTRFRILNMSDYDRADVCLFDPAGRLIYRKRDYKDDFDFSGHTPGTYYYNVTLRKGGASTRHEGFVEVIKQ